LSKEFVRQWLIDNQFQGLDGQHMPEMPDSFVKTVSERYIELYEQITGSSFQKSETSDIEVRIKDNVESYLSKLN
jgi:phosphoribosylaminoimidazole-succinocarboxamide synthase